MGINFPSSDDVFTEPSTPASTPLGSAGDSSRNATLNHDDLGKAVVALQVEATLVVHNHDGTTRNGPKLTQARTHQTPDTDTGSASLHHTIGTGAGQGAAGNHTHGSTTVWPLHAIFITELAGDPAAVHGLPGTWTQIQGVFIVAAGSTFTGGTTGGSISHSHTATFSTTGAHSHTSPNTDGAGSHQHENTGGAGTSTFGHTHGSTGSGSSSNNFRYRGGSGASSMDANSHSHSTLTAGSSGSSTDHTHTIGLSDAVGTHTHTVAAMNSQGDHTHTSSIASASHIPPYLSVYVWERTA